MRGAIFSSRAVIWLVAICGASLLIGSLLGIFQGEIGSLRSAGNDSFSRSALGHRVFVELLGEADYPVIISRHDSGSRAGAGGVLVLAEPRTTGLERSLVELWRDYSHGARRILLVLPKWQGISDPMRPTWIRWVSPVDGFRSNSVLTLLDIEASLQPLPLGVRPVWDAGTWKAAPDLIAPQVIRSEELEPLIASEEGILLGRLTYKAALGPEEMFQRSAEVFVLSDPDLLANHGIVHGDNARLMLRIIEALRQHPEAPVVMDETMHGHSVSPSILRSFFRPPLGFVAIQVLLGAGALLWAGMRRFGSPAIRPPAERGGPTRLVDHTAELLCFGDHGAYLLRRYFDRSVTDVEEKLRLTARGDPTETRRRLVAVSRSRKQDFDLEKVDAEVRRLATETAPSRARLLDIAGELYRWRREMTHGY